MPYALRKYRFPPSPSGFQAEKAAHIKPKDGTGLGSQGTLVRSKRAYIQWLEDMRTVRRGCEQLDHVAHTERNTITFAVMLLQFLSMIESLRAEGLFGSVRSSKTVVKNSWFVMRFLTLFMIVRSFAPGQLLS